MKRFLLANRFEVSKVAVALVVSWVIALVAITVVLLVVLALENWLPPDPHKWSRYITFPGGVLGAYAAIGSLCLYVTMWVYWIVVERSSVGVRLGWLLALLFGMHYGALGYALFVWRRRLRAIVPAPVPYPLRGRDFTNSGDSL